MPIYVYKCLKCQEKTEELREIPEVYDEVICNNCGDKLDGRKSKIVEGKMTVTYQQGSLKGRM